MFECRDANSESQPESWIETRKLPKATASTFYRKLDETLEAIGFTVGVRAICRPAYADAGRGGSPGIDPVVDFKMLVIGFFGKPAQRAVHRQPLRLPRLRAGGSTPDHSSLSVIRS